MRKLIWLSCIVLLLVAACKREQPLKTITGNTPPPDTLVGEALIASYVNNLYVNVLGRKPDSTENATAIASLKATNISLTSRTSLVTQLLAKPEYAQRAYDICRAELLNNVDTADISQQIYVYTDFIQKNPTNPYVVVIQREINKLKLIQQIPSQLRSGAIVQKDAYYRCVDNYVYDQINMGAENFVKASFESFCRRAPTMAELQAGVNMNNGSREVLFLQEGSSRQDFINILLGSKEYYEGQVVSLYLRYLLRQPNSQEATYLALRYQGGESYKSIQTYILTLNEYAGIR
jgi:hypothetical protein